MDPALKSDINFSWQKIANFGTRIGFRVSDRHQRLPVFLETPRLGSSGLSVGEKNGLRNLRVGSSTFYDRKIRRVRDLSCGDTRIYLDVEVRRVDCRTCRKVKQERFDWLADYPFYTKRFAFYVGRRCRDSSIEDIAQELHLDWKTVKSLEKQYMREQLRRVGMPGPKVIGIDEISIRKGHTYRIVVSDLLRQRPIWFGGEDRSEASMNRFFEELGAKKGRQNTTGGHGYVEGLPELYGKACSSGGYSLRQVSCDTSSQRGLG